MSSMDRYRLCKRYSIATSGSFQTIVYVYLLWTGRPSSTSTSAVLGIMETDAIATTAIPGVEGLYDQLDSLWGQYLILLDAYDTAQKQLQKHLADGFFSLAQANFKSSSTRRYGQDHYDARAVATTRANIQGRAGDDDRFWIEVKTLQLTPKNVAGTVDSKPEVKGEVKGRNSSAEDCSPEKASAEIEDHAASHSLPTPDATPELEVSKIPGVPETKPESPVNETETSPDSPSRALRDPIRQFGILVPPSLRAAQKSFSAAVQDSSTVEQAVNASRGMREIEFDIRKLRKAIRKAERQESA